MPQHAYNTRVCRDCDGFAIAVITTGHRHRDGSRAVVRVVCRACSGTGSVSLGSPAATVKAGARC